MPVFHRTINLQTSKDLNAIVGAFEEYLKSQGWKVQSSLGDNKAVLQAQKGGILRDIVAADRALTFTFSKEDGTVKVEAGVGKLVKNLAITAVEVLLLSDIFLFVDVPEILWNRHVETELLSFLQSLA
ncbi:MAG TPA: hypothetical protein VKU79_07560 [Thermoplasmataceae archaeon]|nr:hypothetical protein [Thermoplasmatales archaeon AK]HLH86701.1 hypothetical protein [Thermoplasmataceae archaeon]